MISDNNILYVGSLMDGQIIYFDISGDDPLSFIEKGIFYDFSGQPSDLTFNDDQSLLNDQSLLYVADRTSGNILAISTLTGELDEEIIHDQNGKHPSKILVKGQYLYVLFGTSHQIALYDLTQKTWVKTVLGNGTYQSDILLSNDGLNLFVSRSEGVDILSSQDLSSIKSIENSSLLATPKGLAILDNILFVADYDKNSVIQIDISQNIMDLTTNSCSVGRNPQWISIFEQEGRIYTSNADGVSWFSQEALQVLFQEKDGVFRIVDDAIFADSGEVLLFQIKGGSGTYQASCTGGGEAIIDGNTLSLTAPALIGLNTLTIKDEYTNESIIIDLRIGEKFTISTNPSPQSGGSISISPYNDQNIYNSGDSVVLTANALPCYEFTGWSDQGCSGENPVCDIIMDEDKSISATFNKLFFNINLGIA